MSEKSPASGSSTPILEGRAMTISFPSRPNSPKVDLIFPRESRTSILENKEENDLPLFRVLTGERPADQGQLIYNGVPLSSRSREDLEAYRRRIAVLLKAGGLVDSLTLWDNVALALDIRNVEMDRQSRMIEGLLLRLGILDRKNSLPGDLTSRERKLGGLARAQALEPEILFCEYPEWGLLQSERTEYADSIISFASESGITVVSLTRDASLAELMGQTILHHQDGTLVPLSVNPPSRNNGN